MHQDFQSRFKHGQGLCKFVVRFQSLAKLDEGAHDIDADFGCLWTIEDCGRHDGAMFGKRVWSMPSTSSAVGRPFCGYDLRPQVNELLRTQLEHEIMGKTTEITTNLLIEALCRNPV